MKELSDRVLNYLAQHVVQDFREGINLDDALCTDLNSVTFAQHLRMQIKDQDADWLVSLLSSDSPIQRKLALDMTKPVANHPVVRSALISMWDEEEDESVRLSLVFAILNIKNLNEEQHKKIFYWIRDHEEPFKETVAEWYGGEEKILNTVKMRSEDSSFVKAGNWIYMCCALASNNKSGAREFVGDFQGDNGTFIGEVREYALTRLGG